jgi:hypothetical protein
LHRHQAVEAAAAVRQLRHLEYRLEQLTRLLLQLQTRTAQARLLRQTQSPQALNQQRQLLEQQLLVTLKRQLHLLLAPQGLLALRYSPQHQVLVALQQLVLLRSP